MSFIDPSTSTSQQNQNNLYRFESSSSNFDIMNEPKSSLDSNKFTKYPKSISNDYHTTRSNNMELCIDYNNECYDNTFQYGANNFGYEGEHPYGVAQLENPSFNSINHIGYNHNEESHEFPNQMGKCFVLIDFIVSFVFVLRDKI